MSLAVDILARTLFLPLLVAQGLHVRSRALILPEPEGPRAGSDGTGAPLRLLVLGDSSAAGVGVETQDHALTGQLLARLSDRYALQWKLNAITGATTRSTIARLPDIQTPGFDAIVVALGVNDTTRGLTLRSWLRLQNQLLDQLHTRFDARMIYVSGLPPMGHFPLLPHPLRWVLGRQSQRFDLALQGLLAARPNCRYVTIDLQLDQKLMAQDGFHPGPEVYSAWAEVLAGMIAEDFPTSPPGPAPRDIHAGGD